MNKHFVGCFYFKLTANGNLLGEFLDHDTEIINVESARLIGQQESFVGKYISTWNDGKLHQTNLEISQHNKKYTLIWEEEHNESYEGQGFLAENMLIGYYYKK